MVKIFGQKVVFKIPQDAEFITVYLRNNDVFTLKSGEMALLLTCQCNHDTGTESQVTVSEVNEKSQTVGISFISTLAAAVGTTIGVDMFGATTTEEHAGWKPCIMTDKMRCTFTGAAGSYLYTSWLIWRTKRA